MSVKNVSLILLATNIVALGVALLLKAGFGTDPLTVLQDGLHVRLHVTVGEVALIYNAVILTAAFLLARKKLGFGSAVFSLSVGPFVDMYSDIAVGWGTVQAILCSGFLIDRFRRIPPLRRYLSQEPIS